jgi:hypothetical protein
MNFLKQLVYHAYELKVSFQPGFEVFKNSTTWFLQT